MLTDHPVSWTEMGFVPYGMSASPCALPIVFVWPNGMPAPTVKSCPIGRQ